MQPQCPLVRREGGEGIALPLTGLKNETLLVLRAIDAHSTLVAIDQIIEGVSFYCKCNLIASYPYHVYAHHVYATKKRAAAAATLAQIAHIRRLEHTLV